VQEIEQLGLFYLGREKPATDATAAEQLALYDSRDLVTHALCVGMTGSGKTGLGISLIEEAAIDGVPVIAIDPKGDIADLLLTFPDLRAEDFEPWVNADDAERAKQSVPEFAAAEATKWRDGLGQWGQDGERIRRLRDSAQFTIYTPGSTAGVPVSVLGSFEAPEARDAELLAERAQSAVSGLLALAGIDADSMTSPAHILLTSIFVAAWQGGETLDIPKLIGRVQTPPMQTVGVLAVDDFMPPKDRAALAMALNALVAAPGFAVWTQGDPLDIAAFLRTADGKPRVSIFSIAHLDDTQRMFFVTQLLSALVGWMRAQNGTSSLRALVYMDEIFGFFPPVANPPSKPPLLTLLKQARAFGIGIVLATQNPADLDYKGLGNIGTWWLGRLQTERDKQRVLDGLESASGAGLDRAQVDALLSGLPGRTFLARNIHEQELALLKTRWALSYLRGPLGREEIRRLTAASKPAQTPANSTDEDGAVGEVEAQPSVAVSATAPTVPMQVNVPQYFMPGTDGKQLRPMLYAAVDISLSNARLKLSETKRLLMTTPITDGPIPIDWNATHSTAVEPERLTTTVPIGATFQPLPAAASRASCYTKWGSQLKTWIRDTQSAQLYRSGSFVSRPDESLREFLARVDMVSRETRDSGVDRLREKYQSRRSALEEKVERAREAIARESQQAASQGMDVAISVGSVLAGAILGRRMSRRTGRAVRSAGRAAKQRGDVNRAREAYDKAVQELADFDAKFELEAGAIQAQRDEMKTVTVKPARDGIQLRLLALVWSPLEDA
jgi:hypothetical protein